MGSSPITLPFKDRIEAGRILGEALESYAGRSDVLVLALPRGGVPIGFDVAKAIDAPLDLMLVRKLGVPGRSELAMGAIATGGTTVLNPDVVSLLNISDDVIEQVVTREKLELRRRDNAYRGDLPEPELRGRCIILVDDGVATGATMRAAIEGLRQKALSGIVVAVPVGASDTLKLLGNAADEVICLATPVRFYAIGQWYSNFAQVTDDEVRDLLARSREEAQQDLNTA